MGSVISRVQRRWSVLFLGAAAGVLLISCIDRNNPFDPANFLGPQRQQVKAAQKSYLDSLIAQANAMAAALVPLQLEFRNGNATNDSVLKNQTAVQNSNALRVLENQAIETKNQQLTKPDSLQLQKPYDTLSSLMALGPYPGANANLQLLAVLQAAALTRIDSLNRVLSPLTVYTDSERSATSSQFSLIQDRYNVFIKQVTDSNQAVVDTNQAFAAYNQIQIKLNAAIQVYNSDIAFRKFSIGKILATNADSLRQSVAAAKPGDTIVLAPGTYAGQLVFTQSGTADKPIVLEGYPTGTSILAPPATGAIIFLSNFSYIEFHNLTFQGTATSGAKMENGCKGIVFESCDFRHNALHGIEIVDSDVKLHNCRILQNQGNGVQISGLASNVVLDNVLIAWNAQAGIGATSMTGEFHRLTVADNGKDGVTLVSPLSPLRISNTILALNQGFGVTVTPEILSAGYLQTEDFDVFGNALGKFSVADSLWPTTPIQLDPAFANRDTAGVLDYTPVPGSALSQLESQGVIIGYRK